jgi:GNAT superfamily N-acetyltransferase
MGKVISLKEAGVAYEPPQALTPDHDLSSFSCGEPDLDAWFKRRASKNQISRASRTYVVTVAGEVVAFYCIAVGSIAMAEANKSITRNMPDPIPVMVLGRLAVDETYAGNGIGGGLIKDAVERTLQVSEVAGLAALLVHAKHERAAGFYRKHGFKQSPVRDLTYMLSIKEMLASIT